MKKKYILKSRLSESYICLGLNEDRAEYYDVTKDRSRAHVVDSIAEANRIKKIATYDHINSRIFEPVAI